MAASSKTGQESSKNNSLDERDKLSGRIDFKYAKFAASLSDGIFRRFSEEKLSIRGLNWRILLTKKIGNYSDSFGIYVVCNSKCGDNYDDGWSCRANVGICLHSQKKGGNITKSFGHNFFSSQCQMGHVFNPPDIKAILDPKNEWLDENGTLHISAEISADEPQGVDYVPRPDVLLVNGKEVGVNKHHLACQSKYFERFFFGEEYKKASTELLIDPPANVTHFKRLLDTMEPRNEPLDDKCIEGVLQLANQFLMGSVEGKCRNFLSNCSKHSAVFKYRLAEKYGFDQLKEQILVSSSKREFLKEHKMLENYREYAKLDGKAREALDARLGQLFGHVCYSDDEELDEEPPSKRARAED